MRRLAVRAGLALGGLLVGLALVEGALQVAAVVAPRFLVRGTAVRDDGRLRVACVGDSHVYGAFVPPGAAFPEQLDAVLRRRGIPADVYNYGIPGQNSFQVRARLPRILERLRPEVVIVLVGHNNYWNLSERQITAPEGTGSWTWRDLRLVRLAHVLRVFLLDGAAAARRPDLRLVEQTGLGEHLTLDLGDGVERVDMWRGEHELSLAEADRVTREDLAAIVAMIRAAGARPVLLDYPVALRPERLTVQRAIVGAAVEANVLCLDTEALTHRLQRRGVTGLFFPDLHPTARFYRPMAFAIARQLVRRGLLSGTPPRRRETVDPQRGCVPLA